MIKGSWAEMNSRWSKKHLDTLLGRGGMGAASRDAVLENVLAKIQDTATPRRRWSWSWILAWSGVAATVAALVLLVPRFSQPTFRAKGAQSPAAKPSATLLCLGATLDACPTGSLLALRITGATGYISAWAQPAGGRERIWYFSAETSSPFIDERAPATEVVQRAVRLAAEHTVGSYVVEIRVTPRPMKREELLHAPADATLLATQSRFTVIAVP